MSAVNTPTTPPVSPARFSLPWDLEQWFDRSRILGWVKEEVDSLGWEKPEVVAYLTKHPAYRPRTMLLLLTWGYVTGRLGFSEITEPCRSEIQLQAFAGHQIPPPNSLARFRRDNRALLKWSVSQIYKRAVREKFDLGRDDLLPSGLRRHLESEAVTRIDLARQVDQGSSGA